MSYIRGHWQLFAILAVVFALWQTPVVLPLKIFVVFLHELAHGLAAILTGGRIEAISISVDQGGYAVTRGGSGFAILSAGYLGSLLLGAALLVSALRSDADKIVLGALGMVMLIVCALYIRDGFALLFCLGVGFALIGMAGALSHDICDLVLRVIGLSSLIYVPYDIFDDTIRRSSLPSDARMLAEAVGGTAQLWGGIWLVLSGLVIYWCLRHGIGAHSNLWPRTPSA
ncbi:M50 family metallopeptidase [Sulfitobacter sp. S190]|nr:M50 family metallopeptidase [Sulfitobacter sp. S190]